MRGYAVLLVPITCLVLAADKADDDAVKKEIAKLKGGWSLVGFEMLAPNGEKIGPTPEALKEFKMVITDDKISIRRRLADGTYERTKEEPDVMFKVNPGKTPKEIDMIPINGEGKGKTIKGIYSLEGDTLRFCRVLPGVERPREFKATKEAMFFTLKKDK